MHAGRLFIVADKIPDGYNPLKKFGNHSYPAGFTDEKSAYIAFSQKSSETVDLPFPEEKVAEENEKEDH
jgi:hypothetical protein